MTRMEFLKQLEYLLQDVDEKDREDALTYYLDYMDAAGIAESDSVDGLLDAPEKIAMTIKSSLNGGGDDKSEFSEQGFTDGRMEPESHVPEVYGSEGWKESKTSGETYEEWDSETAHSGREDTPVNNNRGKYIMIGILIVLALPLILGAGGTVFGVIAAVFMCIFGFFIGAAGCAIGFSVGGIALFAASIARMVVSVPEGILMMGLSFIMVALGIISVLLTILICTKLLPWIIRGIVSLFRRLFQRGGKAA